MKRIGKFITNKEDIDYLINTDSEKCCKLSFIMESFGIFDGKQRFHPYDFFVVPEGIYGPEGNKNKKPFTTGVGCFIFNRAFIEDELFDLFGYFNKPITKKVLKTINNTLSYAVLEDKIPIQYMKNYILKTQKFQPYCNILCPTLTDKAMDINVVIKPLKEKLLKKYEKEIKAGDPLVSQKIETELLDMCKKELKDDPFMDLINSGAKISWGNNFKNMFVMRGASKNADPSKGGYTIITGDYMGGIKPEEYAAFCDSLTGGPYARAKKTEVGGAWEKLFVKSLEHIHVLPDGTDCHTKRTITTTLTDKNIDIWMYSYIDHGNGKYEEITSDNKDSLIGKKVKLRYSSLCESKDGICSICAGHLFNRLGIKNIGVATYIVPSKIKVMSMKSFHDSTVKAQDIHKFGINKIFGFEE